jgi:hypothetical protein
MKHMIEQLRMLADALTHQAHQADDASNYTLERELLYTASKARDLAEDLETLEVQ